MVNIINKNGRTIGVTVDVELHKDGDYVVAFCPALNISSFGTNKEEAKVMFEEALKEYVDYLIECNKLDTTLLDLGWTLRKKPTPSYVPPARLKYPSSSKSNRFRESLCLPA